MMNNISTFHIRLAKSRCLLQITIIFIFFSKEHLAFLTHKQNQDCEQGAIILDDSRILLANGKQFAVITDASNIAV